MTCVDTHCPSFHPSLFCQLSLNGVDVFTALEHCETGNGGAGGRAPLASPLGPRPNSMDEGEGSIRRPRSSASYSIDSDDSTGTTSRHSMDFTGPLSLALSRNPNPVSAPTYRQRQMESFSSLFSSAAASSGGGRASSGSIGGAPRTPP